jgi:hypothetical protein
MVVVVVIDISNTVHSLWDEPSTPRCVILEVLTEAKKKSLLPDDVLPGGIVSHGEGDTPFGNAR